jgi:Ankyrin repeats (3 copies)
VNAAAGGATALHRACFSGAAGTIRLLLQVPGCDLLARDTSFGDLQTPLHKAASGGRFLAVQLMLDALQQRSKEKGSSSLPTLLEIALSSTDSSGQTPLDVAREKQHNQEAERQSVARWDVVADGKADWGKCVQVRDRCCGMASFMSFVATETVATHCTPQLLQRASQGDTSGIDSHAPLSRWNTQIPDHLQRIPPGTCSISECSDTVNGTCLTKSWERAFRTALLNNVNEIIATSPLSNRAAPTGGHDITLVAETSNGVSLSDCSNQGASTGTDASHAKVLSLPASKAILPTSVGRSCQDCRRPSIVLYQSRNGQLVCKACRRRRPTR